MSQRECVPNVGVPLRGREIRLGDGRPDAFQDVRARDRQMPGDFRGLVEPTRSLARAMEGNRHDEVGAGKQRASVLRQQDRQRTRQRSSSVVLERVHDGPQRSIVFADGAALSQVMRLAPAARTLSAFDADNPPRRQRIAADVAQG